MATGFRTALCAVVSAACITLIGTNDATAHETMGESFEHTHTDKKRIVRGERYTPTIWVDPDGCEHWVMDDGWEGFMSLKVDRDGMPTCRKSSLCATIPGAAFERGGVWMSRSAKEQVMAFFAEDDSASYKIIGHTDITGGERRNMRLSEGRATMVAKIAQDAGAWIVGVDGHGGQHPRVEGSSHRNHRVEVICLR